MNRTPPARRPLRANYVSWDMPYRPDPTLAVLTSPTGTQGWAIGGVDEPLDERLDTADVERYPADGVTPTGAGESTVTPYPRKGSRPSTARSTNTRPSQSAATQNALPPAQRARATPGMAPGVA